MIIAVNARGGKVDLMIKTPGNFTFSKSSDLQSLRMI